MEAPERCEVLLARAAETEPAADDDSPIQPRQLQLVHRLRVEPRRQPFPFRPLAAESEHVRRDVATVHVQAGAKPRHEQAPGPARHVERRLPTVLDEALEVGDLGAVRVEHRPPARNDAVVPGLR